MYHQILRRVRREPDPEAGLNALDFEDDSWIKSHHRRNLIGRVDNPDDVNEHTYRVNISELQRLYLRKLQHRILQHAVDLRRHPSEPAGWSDDVRKYVQALQDHEYMGKFLWQPNDPFIITGERYIDRCMLGVAMQGLDSDGDALLPVDSTGKWEDSSAVPAPLGGTRDKNFLAIFGRGFLSACFSR
ncbi:hypothetical protein BJ166DRAFT_118768 [Pestalotiopsis sp. NC0098]|nr:hypothetical protein BJ166DRAFT_118768 [Pestalotiopsis sp. NC0098]